SIERGRRIVEECQQIFQLPKIVLLGSWGLGGHDFDQVTVSHVFEGNNLPYSGVSSPIALELRILHDGQAVVASQRYFLPRLTSGVVVKIDLAAAHAALPEPGNRPRPRRFPSHFYDAFFGFHVRVSP